MDPDGNQSIGLEIVLYSELDEFLPFRIDQDGGLRTTMVLDFEQIPSHSLKVRAFDPHGGILEQNFIIEVMDASSYRGHNPLAGKCRGWSPDSPSGAGYWIPVEVLKFLKLVFD